MDKKIIHFGETGKHLDCDREVRAHPYRETPSRMKLSPNHDYYPEVDATGWCYTFDEDEKAVEELA